MGTQFVDLRKYNITNEEDLLEFLDLIAKKLPKANDVIKRQRMQIISLQNQLVFERNKNKDNTTVITQDENASVLNRITNPAGPVANPAADRLAQMRKASEADAKPLGKTLSEVDTIAPAPGSIGNLEVPHIDPKPPVEAAPPSIEEEADLAAGSKSELASDEIANEEVSDEQADTSEATETPEAPSEESEATESADPETPSVSGAEASGPVDEPLPGEVTVADTTPVAKTVAKKQSTKKK